MSGEEKVKQEKPRFPSSSEELKRIFRGHLGSAFNEDQYKQAIKRKLVIGSENEKARTILDWWGSTKPAFILDLAKYVNDSLDNNDDNFLNSNSLLYLILRRTADYFERVERDQRQDYVKRKKMFKEKYSGLLDENPDDVLNKNFYVLIEFSTAVSSSNSKKIIRTISSVLEHISNDAFQDFVKKVDQLDSSELNINQVVQVLYDCHLSGLKNRVYRMLDSLPKSCWLSEHRNLFGVMFFDPIFLAMNMGPGSESIIDESLRYFESEEFTLQTSDILWQQMKKLISDSIEELPKIGFFKLSRAEPSPMLRDLAKTDSLVEVLRICVTRACYPAFLNIRAFFALFFHRYLAERFGVSAEVIQVQFDPGELFDGKEPGFREHIANDILFWS